MKKYLLNVLQVFFLAVGLFLTTKRFRTVHLQNFLIQKMLTFLGMFHCQSTLYIITGLPTVIRKCTFLKKAQQICFVSMKMKTT